MGPIGPMVTKTWMRIVREVLNESPDPRAVSYSVESLPNGLVSIRDRWSDTTGLYRPDGTYQSGDLRLPRWHAARVIGGT